MGQPGTEGRGATSRRRWAIGIVLLLTVVGVFLGTSATGEDQKPSNKRRRGRGAARAPVVHEPQVQERLDYLFAQRRQGHLVSRLGTLGTRGEEADRDTLIAFATKRRNKRHLEAAMAALGRIGDEVSVDFLCSKSGLGRRETLGRTYAAQAIGESGDARAVPALLGALRTRQQKDIVIGACLIALARVDPTSPKVEAKLIEYAKRPRDRVRAGAMEALGWSASDAALARLREALEEDPSAGVRAAAATGLGRAGRQADLPRLENAAARDPAPTVRAAAATSAARLRRRGAG